MNKSHTTYSSHTSYKSHSVCFHCFYNISSIEFLSKFQQVFIFDENYNMEIYRFCSLNCGLKFIMSFAQEQSSKDLGASLCPELCSKDRRSPELCSMDSKTPLVKKLKNFFDYYEVSPKDLRSQEQGSKDLRSPEQSSKDHIIPLNIDFKNFTDLDYKNYRKNFICLEANLPDTFFSPEDFSNYNDTFWSPEDFSNYSDISGIEDSLELCSKDILVNKSCK
jgi:hypothetical protein